MKTFLFLECDAETKHVLTDVEHIVITYNAPISLRMVCSMITRPRFAPNPLCSPDGDGGEHCETRLMELLQF